MVHHTVIVSLGMSLNELPNIIPEIPKIITIQLDCLRFALIDFILFGFNCLLDVVYHTLDVELVVFVKAFVAF